MSYMVNVLLLIESRIYREGLEFLLARRSDIGCAGTCSELQQLPHRLSERRVDIILVDIALGRDDLDARDKILAAYREAGGVPIVALGLGEDESEVLALLEAGAAAFVSKSHSIEDMAEIIISVAQGEAHLAPRMVRLMQERLAELNNARPPFAWPGLARLSQRERHILDLVGRRLSNKQIARELGLEVSTIKNHMHNIIVKLGVKNRVEAAEIAYAS